MRVTDTDIDAGDYVAVYQCKDSACTDWAAHSLVVVGWWDGSTGANCDVDPTYFDDTEYCNRLMTVSGNMPSAPGMTWWQGFTVCQRPVYDFGSGEWVDPPCTWDCDIRLWDTHLNNGYDEGGFFAQMP